MIKETFKAVFIGVIALFAFAGGVLVLAQTSSRDDGTKSPVEESRNEELIDTEEESYSIKNSISFPENKSAACPGATATSSFKSVSPYSLLVSSGSDIEIARIRITNASTCTLSFKSFKLLNLSWSENKNFLSVEVRKASNNNLYPTTTTILASNEYDTYLVEFVTSVSILPGATSNFIVEAQDIQNTLLNGARDIFSAYIGNVAVVDASNNFPALTFFTPFHGPVFEVQ